MTTMTFGFLVSLFISVGCCSSFRSENDAAECMEGEGDGVFSVLTTTQGSDTETHHHESGQAASQRKESRRLFLSIGCQTTPSNDTSFLVATTRAFVTVRQSRMCVCRARSQERAPSFAGQVCDNVGRGKNVDSHVLSCRQELSVRVVGVSGDRVAFSCLGSHQFV